MNLKPSISLFSLLLLTILNQHPLGAQQVVLEEREPEAATGFQENKTTVAKEYMVAAANPYAANAGKAILDAGGSAIDAAVAVQSMLTLVEPQSSGIGGGTFILYWDNQEKRLYTYDGRETAPKKSSEYNFFVDGKPLSWRDAVVGGKSVGVPGALKALEMAHNSHGKLAWKRLFAETIQQSREGFIVSPRLAKLVALDLHPGVNEFVSTKNYFKPNGNPIKAGEIKQNKRLANTLQQVAEKGSDAFYKGPIAQKIAQAVQSASINPGLLSATDMSNYQAVMRDPMCNPYRSFSICSMAPPSSGGTTMYQILKVLEPFELSKFEPDSAEFVHLFSQASALAFADRERYIADLSFLNMSAQPLVSQAYLEKRSASITLQNEFEIATAGAPYLNASYGVDDAYELDSTSHIAIVDKYGNAVSMTSSIEFMFGSGLMVEGFLLNNQLTDFALNPVKNDQEVLNRVEPGKRPRSAMSPTMVFDNNQLKLVVGSPGGSRIINYVAHTLINVLDYKMDIQSAISAPRVTNRNGDTALEKGSSLTSIADALVAKGHKIRIVDLNSGLHGIQIKDGKLLGGADPRREGVALGQ